MSDFTVKMNVPVEHMQNVFGKCDSYVKKIERDLHVTIVNRDEGVRISGDEENVNRARSVLKSLITLSERGNIVEEQNVDYTLEMSRERKEDALLEMDKELICHAVNGKPVKPKTLGQKQYVDAIRDHMIVFGLGPAGTGKT